MKILFMGTGEIALPAFESLLASPYQVLGLVTQPDKHVGRKQVLTAPRIKQCAQRAGLPVWQPQRASHKGFIAEMADLAPDLIVVMAYGQILKKNLLSLPRKGIINVHASLLPQYRGASCIQAAIQNGDDQTGLSIIHVVEQLDAGGIIAQWSMPLRGTETGGEVHDRLAAATPALLHQVLEVFESGPPSATPQCSEDSNYAPKLQRSDGALSFCASAAALERTIRAYDPWPGTYTHYHERKKGTKRRLKIFPPVRISAESESACAPGEIVSIEGGQLGIACQSGVLWLGEVQPEGKRRMSLPEFLQGSTLGPGDRFTA